MTLREQIEEQNRQWRRFHVWESTQPREEREAARLIADVGTILAWMPEDVRLSDPDPEKTGVRKMHEALRKLTR